MTLKTDQEVIDSIIEFVGPSSSCTIPNGYPSAFIGVTYNSTMGEYQAVYSKNKMILGLTQEDGMTYDEALEFLSHNTWNTIPPEGVPVVYIDEV